jgi:threonine dehydratase
VTVEDKPGTLARLLAVAARERGNILHIHHETGATGIPVQSVRILLEIETRGADHIKSIMAALGNEGYQPRLE